MVPTAMLQSRLLPRWVWSAQKQTGLQMKSRKSHVRSSIHSQISHRIIMLGGRDVFFRGILSDDSILRIGHFGRRLCGERELSSDHEWPTKQRARRWELNAPRFRR